MVDAFGAITWWGFSPALDLQDKYQCKSFNFRLDLICVYLIIWLLDRSLDYCNYVAVGVCATLTNLFDPLVVVANHMWPFTVHMLCISQFSSSTHPPKY